MPSTRIAFRLRLSSRRSVFGLRWGSAGWEWLDKHPRFHLHFTPTSSSWLNLIERWFGKLTDKAIRRGIFHSVPELINAIDTYLNVNNENPEPFVWTATAEQILTKVRRGITT
jgi:hypothetical protein